ncbi:enoyl-CoA hydratase-related protein [Sphingobium sp. Sx8-8]|uniref:enoyl-CoA hydratase-related protein n=1 Tax=Sphingobium sp. Sx8-8 TaxID=2933617 RepID=UPI001F56D4B0|nr:enoyl-CoA hydratase-related protein [Sphingobium sp. Sx8-8]
MTDHVKVERADGVLTLTLDRTDKKNALTDAMYKTLADTLEATQEDRSVRAILFRGEGDMFSAGNDISEFAAHNGGAPNERNVLRFIAAIARAEKPLVVAVQGGAIGVAATMLLHCDMVLMSPDARLVTPFVDLALVPEAGSSLLMPQRIGHARAFAMFALAEPVSAQDALAWGLANRIVPKEELREAARALAVRLAAKPPASLIATKRLMREAAALQARMAVEDRIFEERLGSEEAAEAFAAFLERRPPDFSRFH